jgi:hypothetical protein
LSATSGVKSIIDEDVAKLPRRVVVRQEEDEGDGLLLNVKRYMDRFHVGWAKTWAALVGFGCCGAGLPRPVRLVFPLFLFQIFLFYFLF